MNHPNILWLTYEDTSPQFVSCYGMTKAETTPNIDRLAREGVRFGRAFAAAPVCSASRSAIITGISPEASGLGHHRSRVRLPEIVRGFPAWLREAGYYTTNNVKTDYNIDGEDDFVADAWDESSETAHWRDRLEDQPFFAVFNYFDSHQSRTMTRAWGWYEENVLNALDPDEQIGEGTIELPPFYRSDPEMRRFFSRVPNSVKLCDKRMGERLAELENDGLLEDTIIFCFADHGQGIPRGKFNGIGFGYRAAFVARFPERWAHLSPWGAGTVTDELVAFEDLAPTMLSLAGIKPPVHMTGRALAGDYREPEPPQIFAGRNRHDDTLDCCRSAMDRRYVYTRVYHPHLPVCQYQKYADVSDILRTIRKDYAHGRLNPVQAELVRPTRPREYLFDLEADPWEIQNLADDPAHVDALERLRSAVVERMHAINDVMFLSENEMHVRAGERTAFEIRHDPNLNPLQDLRVAAEMVGDPEALPCQLQLLDHADTAVRQWAAIGIFAMRERLAPHLATVRKHVIDAVPAVQVELAAALVAAAEDDDAIRLLKDHVTNANTRLAHQAVEKVLYLPEQASHFCEAIESSFASLENITPGCAAFPYQQGLEMARYLFSNASLYYNEDRPYLDPEERMKDW